jgi:uncharacterized protein YhdP
MIWRRRLRRTRLTLQRLLSTAVILLAVVFALTHLALPWLAQHPERIAEFLSARLDRAVSIEHADGIWERNGPLLVLSGVHVAAAKAGQPPLAIPQAELKINFFSWLSRNQTWNEFRVTGLNLTLVRDIAGAWQLRGLDTAGATDDGDQGNALFDLGSLVLRNLTLTIDDTMANRELAFGADEVRLINNGGEHRVLASVRCLEAPQAPPLDVLANYNSDDGSAQVYFGGQQLDLASILHRYPLAGIVLDRAAGRAQVWTWWQGAQLVEVRTEIDLNNVVLTGATPVPLDASRQIEPHVGFDRLSFGARWKRDVHGWQADVGALVTMRQGLLAPAADIHLERFETATPTGHGYSLRARDVELGAPAAVAMLSDALAADLRRWLYQGDPLGTVRSIELRAVDAQDFDLVANLDGVAWHAMDKLPGVSGLSGTLRGDPGALALALPPHAAFGVDSPNVFRQPLEFSEFSGDIVAYRTDKLVQSDPPAENVPASPDSGGVRPGWRIETDGLTFEGARYGGEVRGAIELHDDGAKPLLDAYAAITHADVPASHLFWPINSMSPLAVRFLDRSLESGRVASARAAFRGELADWPFRNNAGRFEARAETEDVRFPFLPDWPAAEHVYASASFVNLGLHVEAAAATTQGIKVGRAVADIPDISEIVLDLSASGIGAGKDMLGYLRASPLGQKFGAQLLGVDVGGQGVFDLRLHLPVKHADQFELVGNVVLSDADLADAKYGLHLNKASGKVNFTQRGFATEKLPVTVNGKPAEFNLAVGAMTSDPRHAVEANLRATLPATDILAYAPLLQGYSDRLSGSAQWTAGFVADSDAVKNPAQRLTLKSDLHGVALDLPEPLHKNADEILPLSLTLGMPFAGGSLDVQVADWLHLHGRLASPLQPFAARIDLGTASEAPLPPAGFYIAGTSPRLDITGWLDFATSGSGNSAPAAAGSSGLLAGIDLHTAAMSAWERDFGAASFKLAPANGALDIAFAGANVEGTLRVPLTELRQRGITAQFTRLYWPSAAEPADGDGPAPPSTANPAALPPLHVHIGDCRLGEANFGDTTIESYPVADGTHFDHVATHSDNLEMRAHGDWTGRPGSDSSRFAIDFTARNLGRMLDAFGYAGVVDGGQTVAHIEGSWRGSPSAFALAALDGTLKVSVQQGRIPEANTGAGRIFGLFNLGALPRRLTLDFGDLFKSGFSFDSIKGLFTLKTGNASTADLEVKGPTADIRVSGRTGLKGKDYDQIMDVTPHVGGTLAVGGALVGGPVGAAAGALLQGIFRNQINQATRIRYSVTGSWDKPVITQLSKETVKPSKPKETKG